MLLPNWYGGDRAWSEIRYLVEKKSGLHSGRSEVSTTVYVGHLEGDDERNLIALADDYIVGANDNIVVKRLPSGYKCRTWIPLSQSIAEQTYDCSKKWEEWSHRIITARGAKVPEPELLRMCLRQQMEGILGYKDERFLKPHSSRKYIREHYHGYRHSTDEIKPIIREPCHLCLDIITPHGHSPGDCPAALEAGSRWQGLSSLKRPTGIPWINLREVECPTTIEEVIAVQWHDPIAGKFWCTQSKKSGARAR
jgi:hypothetical protein